MAKYKIEIDRDLCVGDGACCDEAPETFELDDEDIAVVKQPAQDEADTILNAAKQCPTDAIILHDQESSNKVWPED